MYRISQRKILKLVERFTFVKQALPMNTTWSTAGSFEPINAQIQDGLLSLIQPTSLTSDADLRIHLSTTTMGITEFAPSCMPTQLVDENKRACMETFMHFLQRYQEGENFLQQILTRAETWVYKYEPTSKCQGVEWRHIVVQDKDIQICAFSRQSDVNAVLGHK
jgi:hypothetical protein